MSERLQGGFVLVVPLRTKPEPVKLPRNHLSAVATIVDIGWALERGMVTFLRLPGLHECLDNAQALGGIVGVVLWGQELDLTLVGPFRLKIFSDFMTTTQTRGSSWPLSTGSM